jgi:hypothetical protein
MSVEWLDKIHSGNNTVFNVGQELIGLGRVMFRAGNENVARELFDYAERLDAAHKLIDNGVGENINGLLRAADESSAEMLKTGLAIAQIMTERDNAIRDSKIDAESV